MNPNNKKLVIFDFSGVFTDTFANILVETIKNLHQLYLLSIISSTSTSIIINFLEKENISNYFSDILGVDINKDKAVKINNLLEKYSVDPNNAVFITDTIGDILSGNKCGVKSIGVTWGLHDKENLEKGNPVEIIDDPRKLLSSIQNVLK